MLNSFNKDRKYYDNLYFYFTRDRKIGVYFSLNFIELLKDKTDIPVKFIEDNSELLKNQYSVKLFLADKDNKPLKLPCIKTQISNKYNPPRVKNLSKCRDDFFLLRPVNLFTNSNFRSYSGKFDISNITGIYKIVGEVSYNYSFYEYVSSQINNEDLDISEKSKFIKLKIIMDRDNAFFTNSKKNNLNIYSFESPLINFHQKSLYASNLYDIYEEQIGFEDYKNYLDNISKTKGITYDGNLPLTKYSNYLQVTDLNFNLSTKEGNQHDYQNLMMGLLQDSSNSFDYKEFSSIQSIYIQNPNEKNKRKQKVQNYQKLNNNLESLACDNNLFVNPISQQTSQFKDSEILLLANYINNIPDLQTNDFWKDDLTLIPVYLLDIFATYDIYYLISIEEKSMSNTWKKLTNFELENLSSGNYLCKINSIKDFISPYLIETYFILVK
jgi:hypothetical protein